MPRRFITRQWLIITSLTVLAGIAYNSWPLGYWLNPVVNRGLASDLEATGQPYNWVFISLDIISGALICLATLWLANSLRKRLTPVIKVGLVGFGAFGLLTAVDALLPLNCVSTVQRCGPVLQDPYYIIHGIASIGSIVGLTLSIISLWWILARDNRIHVGIRLYLHSTMLTWVGFGIFTLVLIALSRNSGNAQHIFIVVCSLWTASMPYLLWRALEHRTLAIGLKQVEST